MQVKIITSDVLATMNRAQLAEQYNVVAAALGQKTLKQAATKAKAVERVVKIQDAWKAKNAPAPKKSAPKAAPRTSIRVARLEGEAMMQQARKEAIISDEDAKVAKTGEEIAKPAKKKAKKAKKSQKASQDKQAKKAAKVAKPAKKAPQRKNKLADDDVLAISKGAEGNSVHAHICDIVDMEGTITLAELVEEVQATWKNRKGQFVDATFARGTITWMATKGMLQVAA